MGYLLLDDIVYINDEIHQKHHGTEVKENDVLLNITGASIGRTAIATKKIDGGNVNQHVCIIRSNGQIDTHFLCYYIQTDKIQKYIQSLQTGGSREGLNFEQIRSFPICLPMVAEQKKIAKLLSLLDERIATQNRLIEDLKKLKCAISKRLIWSSDLLEKKIPISKVGSLKNGYAFQSPSYDSTGKYAVVTIANVTGERYISSTGYNHVIAKPRDIQEHQKLMANDILISLTGNVERVSLCREGKYLLNQRVGLLQLHSDVNREFVYQVLSSRHFEQSMISCSQGAAQMNIGKGDIENYMMPYSCKFQNLHIISSILKVYDARILIEDKILQLFNRQKAYLLASLFI